MMAGPPRARVPHRIGIAMRATSQNPQIAGLMGVDIDRVISFTFVVGAALGAVAGVMVGTYYGIAHYQMGFLLGLKASAPQCSAGIGNLAAPCSAGSSWDSSNRWRGLRRRLTNVCFLDEWLPGFAEVAARAPSPASSDRTTRTCTRSSCSFLVLVFRPRAFSANASATGVSHALSSFQSKLLWKRR
jgi:branched-chain amino acid transport system permease protein